MVSSVQATHFAHQFGLTDLFPEGGVVEEKSAFETVDPNHTEPYLPEWPDLTRLFALIRLRKVTSVLEFGCGFSTAVMAYALDLNEVEFGAEVCNQLRRSEPFHLHVVDDMKPYLDLTRARLGGNFQQRVTFHLSKVRMTRFSDRICTEYETLPNVCPDFIYLDGPSQSSVVGEVNGISTRHPDRLPMACDVLKIEHFLLPGTLLVVDGRTANSRFLKSNLQREWRHEHDEEGDVHYFEMIEEPLGKWNRRQIEFCLGADWRSKPLRPDLSKVVS